MEPPIAETAAEWSWLTAEVRRAATAFGNQLRTVGDSNTKVPNLDWTVAELAAHLICLPDVYRSQAGLDGAFVAPDDWAAFSIASRAHITETDTARLADQLDEVLNGWIAELDPDGGGPRLLYGQVTTGKNITAGILTELLLHGMDLAAITGATVTMTREHAVAALPAMMALVPAFIDPAAARRCEGVYHLRFRGGPEYAYRVDGDGHLTVADGKPDKADVHLIADPVTFMKLSLGRTGQIKAALTGKVMAYGRKPWLLAWLEAAKVPGV